MWSPPTSCARAAISVVAVMMLSFFACADTAPKIAITAIRTTLLKSNPLALICIRFSNSKKTSHRYDFPSCSFVSFVVETLRFLTLKATKSHEGNLAPFLEWMCSMRAQRKDELHEQFVAVAILGVVRETILATNLAELARPVRKRRRCAFVCQIRELASIRPVIASPGKPAAPELIITRGIEPKRLLLTRELLSLAPYELTASHERMVDGTAQRLPAHGGINPVKLGNEVARHRHARIQATAVVPARIGDTQVEVG